MKHIYHAFWIYYHEYFLSTHRYNYHSRLVYIMNPFTEIVRMQCVFAQFFVFSSLCVCTKRI